MCLNAWPIESDNIRRYGLVGIDVALVEEIYNCGLWALGSPMLKLCPVQQ